MRNISLSAMLVAGVAPNDEQNSTLALAKKVKAFLQKLDFAPIGEVVIVTNILAEVPLSWVEPQPPEDAVLNYGIQLGSENRADFKEGLPMVPPTTHNIGMIISKIKAGEPGGAEKWFQEWYASIVQGIPAAYQSLPIAQEGIRQRFAEAWKIA